MATLKDLIVLGKSRMTDNVYAPEYYEGGVSLIDKYLTSASTVMGNYATSANVTTALSEKASIVIREWTITYDAQ